MKLINFRAVMKNFALDRIVLSPDSRCVAAAIIFAAILIPFRTTGKTVKWKRCYLVFFFGYFFYGNLKLFIFHEIYVSLLLYTYTFFQLIYIKKLSKQLRTFFFVLISLIIYYVLCVVEYIFYSCLQFFFLSYFYSRTAYRPS